ncbi:hypothetical protein M6B38_258475 [Iris pallida]|uniref:Uncharacterized protein n=1 Tax=Iris pallida TaxID=29817 RepID=A0AAX6IH83_IRIPA|nr:hypothetical protein M6B38_258475 [Iris pallida]
MQETPAGAKLPSNVLRRGANSGALERCKKLKHPIQDIMYQNIAMNHYIPSCTPLGTPFMFQRERELERLVNSA